MMLATKFKRYLSCGCLHRKFILYAQQGNSYSINIHNLQLQFIAGGTGCRESDMEKQNVHVGRDTATPATPSHVCKKVWTQEARFKFWLCLQLLVTLNTAFDLPGPLSPSPGSKRWFMPPKIPAHLL